MTSDENQERPFHGTAVIPNSNANTIVPWRNTAAAMIKGSARAAVREVWEKRRVGSSEFYLYPASELRLKPLEDEDFEEVC